MLRKVLVVVVVLLLLWGGAVLLARTAERRQLRAAWPAGLGPVDSVPARYPDRPMNDSARRLVGLAAATGIDIAPGVPHPKTPFDAVAKEMNEYLRVEMSRAGVAPAAAPSRAIMTYLAQRDPAIVALQQHLVNAPAGQWPQRIAEGADAPLPKLAGLMQLTRLLVTSALVKRQWEPLHAAWKLEQQLHGRPELVAQLVGNTMVRMINAAARSMPLPEPAWMNELRARDYRRAMLESLQAESWISRQMFTASGSPDPYTRLSWTDLNASYVRSLGELATGTACVVHASDLGQRIADGLGKWNILGKIAVPNLGAAWQRVARLRVELEATEKLALAKQGRFDARSRCSDGGWTLQNGTIRFAKPLPPVSASDVAVPTDLPVPAPQQSI